jgi:hypothetical protein
MEAVVISQKWVNEDKNLITVVRLVRTGEEITVRFPHRMEAGDKCWVRA